MVLFGWLVFVGSRGLVCLVWLVVVVFCLFVLFKRRKEFASVVKKRQISQGKPLTQHRRRGGIILGSPLTVLSGGLEEEDG